MQIVASGEVLALGGYPFPPATPNDVAFVDGWELRFSELIVTVDHITLSSNPDQVPTDPSQTGPAVAEVDGPWAIDLHKGGPIAGKGGSGEEAVAIAEIDAQNKNGNAPFDPTARYAFGFDVVPASAAAKRVNLDATGAADYADMIASGTTVLYVGTATFRGTTCTPAIDPALAELPRVVNFRLGFQSPTSYVNCQNPDNDPHAVCWRRASAWREREDERADDRAGHDSHRSSVLGKRAARLARPFRFVRVAGARCSPMAVRRRARSRWIVRGVPFIARSDDRQEADLRGEAASMRRSVRDPATNPMRFDTKGIPVDMSASPATALRDLYDYVSYIQSTQGHLNSDGLCFVRRNYLSPP